ncbi:MAG TPA: 3-phosphoglycerate dehydrogenase [Candidatus Latescibacteria bacterium]|mgnify:FL=1|nr:3-phosphoglycerate dehydrogenase [Candidatus Latescibacterota bacterium]
MSEGVNILVPGDDPPQIADSPQLDRLQSYGDVTLHTTRPSGKAEQIDRARDFQVVINSRGSTTWREPELRALPDLKMITTCSIGTDMIDLAAAKQLGIVVSNQPGRTAPVVAEHMFGLLFSIAKRAAFQTAEIRAHRWTRRMNLGVQGKILGIVGVGNIGAEMARLGQAMGMDVIAWTFHPTAERAQKLGVRFVELDELLEQSDYVSLHVALTDDTHHLIGESQLARMKSEAVLLNGARGAVVDLDALARALDSGHLAGAGLDVFPDEPFEVDHPIKQCEQVVLTPHAADQTPEGVDLLNGGAVDNVIAFLEGKPQNNVAV